MVKASQRKSKFLIPRLSKVGPRLRILLKPMVSPGYFAQELQVYGRAGSPVRAALRPSKSRKLVNVTHFSVTPASADPAVWPLNLYVSLTLSGLLRLSQGQNHRHHHRELQLLELW